MTVLVWRIRGSRAIRFQMQQNREDFPWINRLHLAWIVRSAKRITAEGDLSADFIVQLWQVLQSAPSIDPLRYAHPPQVKLTLRSNEVCRPVIHFFIERRLNWWERWVIIWQLLCGFPPLLGDVFLDEELVAILETALKRVMALDNLSHHGE
ncbi:MAG: hypothetical protein Q6K90_07415 [Gloeomargarita sp. HHBFW_bins_162]